MSGRPSVVRVRLKRGAWEVEIECEESRVKEAIESVLSGLSSVPEVSPPVTEERGLTTCRGLIEQLWKEEWFSTMRGLSDTHDELARRGYHYDRTAVSHSLADLVRGGLLTREGTQRSYRYIQKKPPIPSAQ